MFIPNLTILMPREPASSPSTISWQTAWFSLLPLAIAVMTQPCGSVCGLPTRYRGFLRSSPIICVVDTAYFMSLLVLSCVAAPGHVAETLRALLKERFLDEETQPAGRWRQMENAMWARWAFFAVGCVPLAVKFVVMEGIPWTKTWSMMFVVSFVLSEVFIVLSRILRPHLEVAAPSLEITPSLQRAILELSGFAGAVIGCVCLLLQTVFLGYIFGCVLLKMTESADINPLLIGVFLTLGLFCIAIISAIYSKAPYHSISFFTSIALFGIAWFLLSITDAIRVQDKGNYPSFTMFDFWKDLYCAYVIELMCPIPFALIIRPIWSGSGRLITKFDDSYSPLDLYSRIASFWVSYLSYTSLPLNFLLSLLFYTKVYDPTGTVNPDWTKIFG